MLNPKVPHATLNIKFSAYKSTSSSTVNVVLGLM